MHEILANVCIKTKCRLIEFSGEPDHFHLLMFSQFPAIHHHPQCTHRVAMNRVSLSAGW
ncbi:MAG: transposase [Nostoc sp.]|uniref:transposase n=1 Tax=Nostoc sp. JL33 TaxID=2815396 RepID=UPI0025E58679|nr:transposase [Nostoc sp. JL33]